MNVSFSSLALVNDPFDWAYDLEELGFTGWEVVSEGKQKLNEETMLKIKNILETTNLTFTLHLPFSDLNLASLNHPIWNETIKQLSMCLEKASDFIDFAVVHPGHLSPLGMQLPEMAWQANIDGLKAVCDAAADYGVTIGVENMPNMKFIFGRMPGEILGMIDSLERENVGLTFDIGHANTNGLVSEFLEETDRMVHVHVHDNKGRSDDHLEVGKGTIDWKEVWAGLRGFKGRMVVEARTIEEGTASLRVLEGL